jgi:hypothetical protein
VSLFTLRKAVRTEPTMELFGPYTAQLAWRLYRAIDWTHMHHEQTYDLLSERSIPWDEKQRWTDRAVRYYVEKNDVAFSPAPLDVTMRRAAVMMKPYFGYARTYYPRATDFAYLAHWWHPVVYEAMMIGGNDAEQDAAVDATNRVMVVDPEVKLLVTKTLGPTLRMHRLHLNGAWMRNAGRGPDERQDRYRAIVGYSVRATPDAILVADFVRESGRLEDEESNLFELGLRIQVTPLTTVAIGAGAGLGDESPDVRATIGLQHSLALASWL